MFFEQENISFMILDVMKLKYGKGKTYNTGRKFHALSYRFEADTQIEVKKNTKNEIYRLTNGVVGYFPANTNYIRTDKYDKMIVVHFLCFGNNNKNIEYFYPKNPQKYEQKFIKLYNIWKAKDVAYKMKAASVLYEIFALIYSENKPKTTKNPIINDAVEYLHKNFQMPDITTKNLADISHISEVYFRKLFKQEYGISPKKYIIDLRIKYASELIQTGYFRITEISEMCGFTDYRYFSSEFKKHKGCSPSKYGK